MVTEQNPGKLGATVNEIDVSSAIIRDSKMCFSMMTPKIKSYLTSNPQIEDIILFGIESHVCIYQTAWDLLSHNYKVFIAADGVGSMNPSEVPIALEVHIHHNTYLNIHW